MTMYTPGYVMPFRFAQVPYPSAIKAVENLSAAALASTVPACIPSRPWLRSLRWPKGGDSLVARPHGREGSDPFYADAHRTKWPPTSRCGAIPLGTP